MMDLYTGIKTFHIVSSTIVFGAGIGIAFLLRFSTCQKTQNSENDPPLIFAVLATQLERAKQCLNRFVY